MPSNFLWSKTKWFVNTSFKSLFACVSCFLRPLYLCFWQHLTCLKGISNIMILHDNSSSNVFKAKNLFRKTDSSVGLNFVRWIVFLGILSIRMYFSQRSFPKSWKITTSCALSDFNLFHGMWSWVNVARGLTYVSFWKRFVISLFRRAAWDNRRAWLLPTQNSFLLSPKGGYVI